MVSESQWLESAELPYTMNVCLSVYFGCRSDVYILAVRSAAEQTYISGICERRLLWFPRDFMLRRSPITASLFAALPLWEERSTKATRSRALRVLHVVDLRSFFYDMT
jgi:hypothetical protein